MLPKGATMIYTRDDRFLMKIHELATLLHCSYVYIKNILSRHNFSKYWDIYTGQIEVNQQLFNDLKEHLEILHTRKSKEILRVLQEL